MKQTEILFLEEAVQNSVPFPHFHSKGVLSTVDEECLFDWLEECDMWELVKADFYTQYEFSFEDVTLPERLRWLVGKENIQYIENEFRKIFNLQSIKLTNITAHKLVSSHKISIHNDYIDGEETHRLLLQINRGWREEHGGFLMMFNSFDASDVAAIYKPVSNSVVGFEISEKSYHAVSTINDFSRYTLVFTFKGK